MFSKTLGLRLWTKLLSRIKANVNHYTLYNKKFSQFYPIMKRNLKKAFINWINFPCIQS